MEHGTQTLFSEGLSCHGNACLTDHLLHFDSHQWQKLLSLTVNCYLPHGFNLCNLCRSPLRQQSLLSAHQLSAWNGHSCVFITRTTFSKRNYYGIYWIWLMTSWSCVINKTSGLFCTGPICLIGIRYHLQLHAVWQTKLVFFKQRFSMALFGRWNSYNILNAIQQKPNHSVGWLPSHAEY